MATGPAVDTTRGPATAPSPRDVGSAAGDTAAPMDVVIDEAAAALLVALLQPRWRGVCVRRAVLPLLGHDSRGRAVRLPLSLAATLRRYHSCLGCGSNKRALTKVGLPC